MRGNLFLFLLFRAVVRHGLPLLPTRPRLFVCFRVHFRAVSGPGRVPASVLGGHLCCLLHIRRGQGHLRVLTTGRGHRCICGSGRVGLLSSKRHLRVLTAFGRPPAPVARRGSSQCHLCVLATLVRPATSASRRVERPLATVLGHLGVLAPWRQIISRPLDGLRAVVQGRHPLGVRRYGPRLPRLLQSLPLALGAVHDGWVSFADVQLAVLLRLPLRPRTVNSHCYFTVARLGLLSSVLPFLLLFRRHSKSGQILLLGFEIINNSV